MRSGLVALFVMLASLAIPASAHASAMTLWSWLPPTADPATGARPGNEIGTGMSLPMSDKAGNITPQDTGSALAARLPTPAVDDNAAARDFLIAARNALAAGRTGEAQEALERAETRLLDRSVPLFQTTTPIQDPMAERIQRVLHTLATGDRMQAMQVLEQAIAAAPSN